MTDKSYSPGLEGVIAGESALSRIDIDINRLILHGYDLVELTENASLRRGRLLAALRRVADSR